MVVETYTDGKVSTYETIKEFALLKERLDLHKREIKRTSKKAIDIDVVAGKHIKQQDIIINGYYVLECKSEYYDSENLFIEVFSDIKGRVGKQAKQGGIKSLKEMMRLINVSINDLRNHKGIFLSKDKYLSHIRYYDSDNKTHPDRRGTYDYCILNIKELRKWVRLNPSKIDEWKIVQNSNTYHIGLTIPHNHIKHLKKRMTTGVDDRLHIVHQNVAFLKTVQGIKNLRYAFEEETGKSYHTDDILKARRQRIQIQESERKYIEKGGE